MSVIGEDLLGKKINKKRVLGIVLIAILLISMFAFSTVLLNLLFGIQRSDFNDSIEDKEDEIAPPLTPYFPWEDFNFSDIPPVDLEDLLDMISDLLDGVSDDLDLSQFSEGLMALLASAAAEMEVFRVYNYSVFNEMDAKLWKYECYNYYNTTEGSKWQSTVPLLEDDFYTFNNYSLQYWYLDLLKIKMPLSPNASSPPEPPNSIALPSLFPIPGIIKESIDAQNNLSVSTIIPGYTKLKKNLFNSTKADLYFSSNDDVNMTYNLFGLDLPSNDDINSSAVKATNPTQEYLDLLNSFTQIPPDLSIYMLNNPYFTNHFNILNNSINVDDNAFIIANKIRNYLQTNFYFNYIPSPDPGRDAVDWFCEQQQGLWPDFASAFSIFSRAFGVASRFVTGFNSRWIEEFTDYNENPPFGETAFAIKYKNLYNWAEIFVPFNISGNGEWVQMDILFDSYGPGGSPITGNQFNITVTSDKILYNRPDVMNLTATLSSFYGDPLDNKTITFTDMATGQILGVDDTDVSGTASISVNIDNSYVIGPHNIEARYDFFSFNYTWPPNVPLILGNIGVSLSDVNPTEVNRSDHLDDETYIQGYVYDPLNGERVKDAEVNFVLLHKGTTIEEPGAFNPISQTTGNSGEFDTTLSINSFVPSGQYEIRVDFNGTWWIDSLIGPIPVFQPSITNSSNRWDFNITKSLSVWFYINNTPAINPNIPLVSRFDTITLTARVMLENFGPKPNKEVFFYDYSRGNIEIGSAISDINGNASITYDVGDYCISGPNLLYANISQSIINYSYFILDENPTINAISGPTPRIINRTGGGSTTFNIIGNITDGFNSYRPLAYSVISLRFLRGGSDYWYYLTPFGSNFYQTDSTGTFDLTFGVDPNTPPGNYTLRLDFNGTIDLTSYPYQPPYVFNLTGLSTSTVFYYKLKVETPATLSFNFWINGYPSNDIFNPTINRNDDLNLTVYLQYGPDPIPDNEWVDFYDLTQDQPLGSAQTTSGYAELIYPINDNTIAGPHLIYATWNNRYNYSYYILDDLININLDRCPQPPQVNRSGSVGRNFLIHGYLNDSKGNPIINSVISVHLMDGVTDVSYYLNLYSGSLTLDETGEIDLTYYVSASTPAKNYTLEVRFNGLFDYTSTSYPYFFNLNLMSNFTDSETCFYDLKVIDPDDINIYFFVDGIPTRSFYNNSNPPEWYYRGGSINFSVYITRSGSPVTGGTVSFTDVFTGDPLGSSSVSNGLAWISANTSSWHAGLHRVRAQWSGSGTFNRTYVIINETVTIFANSVNSIVRVIDNFHVDGTLQESGEYLRGLIVNIKLLDNTLSDVSGYLIGTSSRITNNAGYYQFSNWIDITCPRGKYYIKIDFEGGIQYPISLPDITLTDYMVYTNSSLIPIKIIAGTSITGNYDTEYHQQWYGGDSLYVYGYLRWDNGTAIGNKWVNITIWDGSGNILDSLLGFTASDGFFNVSFTIELEWDEDTAEVRAYFFPEDPINFGIPDGTYINTAQQQIFREP